jgi:hypothetical protein
MKSAGGESTGAGDLWRRVTKQLAEVTPSPGDVNRRFRLTTNWEVGQARRQWQFFFLKELLVVILF